MIIRVLGGIVGLAIIVTFGLMLFEQHSKYLLFIPGFLMGVVFLIYSFGGKKALLRILPNLAKKVVGK